MDQEHKVSPPQDEPAPVAKQLELPKPRRARRERVGAERLSVDTLAGAQAIDRMAEASRRLAEQEKAVAAKSGPESVGGEKGRPAAPVGRQRLPALARRVSPASFAAFRHLPSNLPLYAAALCLAVGVGGLLGGQFGPVDVASADGEKDRVERPLASRRDTADKAREEINGLRAELAALRANGEQLRQAENQKQANELRALRTLMEAQRTETSALKADFAARADRDRENAQRADKAGERIDRLERRLADATPTATVTKAVAAEPPPKVDKLPLPGVILRDVARGVALIETRRGLMEVTPGDPIPGAGRVETIEKHAGRWRVVTTNGVIGEVVD